MHRLDELDAELLGRLEYNSRLSVTELASQLGVTRNTVHSRMRRMESLGVIVRYGVVVNLRAAGMPASGLFLVRFDPSSFSAVANAIRGHAQVVEVTRAYDGGGVVVRAVGRSCSELQALAQRIADMPEVTAVHVTPTDAAPLSSGTAPAIRLLTRTSGYGRSTPLPLGGPVG